MDINVSPASTIFWYPASVSEIVLFNCTSCCSEVVSEFVKVSIRAPLIPLSCNLISDDSDCI